jgi:hypothetical protein
MFFRGISRQIGLGGDQQTNWNDGATTFSMMTISIMTHSIMDLIVTLSINQTQHNNTRHEH